MVFTSIDLTLVPNVAHYRRPNLTWVSSTVVSVETGLDGTSGDAVIMFPDGNIRTETSSSRYQMTISQNAVFTNATLGSNQGGLRTGSVTSNTWYACYAVKVTTFTANWVLVADTVLPIQANYSTLNTNFGTNGWLYLGLIRYGDGLNFTTSILNFFQTGNMTIICPQNNSFNYGGDNPGPQMATTAGATSLTYTYAAGTGNLQVPNNIGMVYWGVTFGGSGSNIDCFVTSQFNGHIPLFRGEMVTGDGYYVHFFYPATMGIGTQSSISAGISIWLEGWTDLALGVGSNPFL
jgi:hypothetical protein